MHHPQRGGHGLGQVANPAGPGGDDAVGGRRLPQQHPGVHLGERQQVDLHSHDDPEVAAGAAHGPEQLALLGRRAAHEPAVGRDQLDRAHVVDRQAVLTAVERHPARERVTDDAHVGGAAVGGGQAVLGRRVDDRCPRGAADDAGGARRAVDPYAGELVHPQQQRAREPAVERRRAVAGALRGDPQAEAAGGADERDDLLDGPRHGDGRRALVDREVPGHPGGVVPRGAGEVDASRSGLDEGAEVRGPAVQGMGVGGGQGHGVLSLGGARDHRDGVGWTGGAVEEHEESVRAQPLDLVDGEQRPRAGLGEALGEHVEDRPDPVVVDGGDPQAGEVVGPEPEVRQAGLDPGQPQRELGRGVVLVEKSPGLVQGGLGRDRERAAGHGITVGPGDPHPPSRSRGDFWAVGPGWTGPPRIVGCRVPSGVRTIEGCLPRP